MATNYQVAVVPGPGMVLREADTIVILEGTDRPDSTLVERLRTAALSGPADDRVKRLARILLDEDSPPPVAVVTLVDDRVSVFLYGAVDMVVGADRTSGEGQVLGATAHVLLATTDLAVVPTGTEAPDLPTWSSLGQGAVRGAGVVIRAPEPGAAPPTPRSEASLPPPPPPPTPPVSAPTPATPAPAPVDSGGEAVFESISLMGDIDLTDRDPLPVETGEAPEPHGDESMSTGPAYQRPVEVLGVYSPRGFFNHPEAKYCSRSGVKMGASHTLVLTGGPRPPLGVLTFDDGATYTVQWNTVIGRDPSGDGRVERDEAADLAVDDDSQSVSRCHLLLELVDWQVMVSDLGSQNGTYVQESSAAPERRLGDGEQVVMGSGDAVRFGSRSFVYHAHHVQ